jgi:hypothetical protein
MTRRVPGDNAGERLCNARSMVDAGTQSDDFKAAVEYLYRAYVMIEDEDVTPAPVVELMSTDLALIADAMDAAIENGSIRDFDLKLEGYDEATETYVPKTDVRIHYRDEYHVLKVTLP